MKHLVLVVFVLFPLLSAFAADRPNILWLTCEDMSPDLGCYGDTYARTPHIDRLAARGIRFTRAFAESPMCAPSRSALISGMHTGPLGTSQMRSAHPIPTAYRGFPAWLRDQTPGPHRQERCPPRQPVANDARRHGRESARQISRRRSRRHHQGNRRMTMSSNPIPAKGRLHRFRVLRWSSAALLAFLFFLGAAQAAERPNIVIFLADDLGYGSVGYQGGKPKTPTLDTLAKESVRFTDFYTGMCNCSPSRASLLTGRSATRVGLYNWRPRASRMVLRGSEVTLAELLRGAGYRTGVFGKWHLGEVTPLEGVLTPVDHGFEHSFVTDLNAEPSHHNPVDFIRNGVAVGESQGYSCQIVVDEALRVLETVKLGESFFHYIPFHEPHVPLASPEELVKGYPDATKEEAVYYANVENMDRAIGRYLAALKTRGLSGNTLVLFASDNGPTGPGSSRGGLRAGKDALYDGGIKVPALLSWPSRIPKPRTISEPVALVDVMPTLCEAAGVAAPADRVLDGTSFLPLLTGGTFTRAKPLFWFYFNRDPGAALRSGDWNLVARTTGFQPASHDFTPEMMELVRSRTFDTFELFNLKADPGQRNDLATQHPEKLAELKKQLLDSLASARAEGPDWRVAK